MTGALVEEERTGSLDVHAAFDRLCAFEEEADVLRYTFEGWAVWPLMRFEVAQLLTAPSLPSRPGMTRGQRIRVALTDVPHLLRPRHARHLIKTYVSGLSEKRGDRFSDVWFDDVAIPSPFKVEAINNFDFIERSRRALVRRDLSTVSLDIGASLLSRGKPSREVTDLCTLFTRLLRDRLGLSAVDSEWVSRRLVRFSAARRVYAALLRRVKPKFVLVADSGEYSLVAAAAERGCETIELQHGITDASHAGYSWTGYARPFRRSMPIPSRLLLFGEHWRSELDRHSFWGESLRVTGCPRIDHYRSLPSLRSEDECTVLYTTQGIDAAGVAAFLASFVREVRRRVPLRLIVKLHPIYGTDKAAYLSALGGFSNFVEVRGGNEGPSTFDLLKRAHFHLSVSSAAHYDAIGLGVPTVVLPFSTHEIVSGLYRAGHAMLVATPADLTEIVSGWRTVRMPEPTSDYYFEPGAVSKIRRELELPNLAETTGEANQ